MAARARRCCPSSWSASWRWCWPTAWAWSRRGLNEALGQVSRVCLVVAIAALGIKTSFEELVKLGWRPMALMVAETLWLVVIFAVYLCFLR